MRKHVDVWLLNFEAMTSWMNRGSFLAILRIHGQLVISPVVGGSVSSDSIHFEHIGCN